MDSKADTLIIDASRLIIHANRIASIFHNSGKQPIYLGMIEATVLGLLCYFHETQKSQN